MDYKYSIAYRAGGALKETSSPENDDFSVVSTEKDGVLSLVLEPKREVEFEKFEIVLPIEFDGSSRFFTNGYQSWTVSREYCADDSMDEFSPTLLGIPKHKVNPIGIWGAGDLTWHKYPTKQGVFYGYSYAYIRNGESIKLFASLSERAGYTVMTFDTNEKTLTVGKDLQGVKFRESKELLSLAVIEDGYEAAFDRYFALMNVPAPKVERKCGYTTWYNYYTKVDANIVKRDLEAIAKLDTKIDIFQIDDGYESAVGDWLIYDEVKFPKGMKEAADDIHSHGMLAGLWLAPFSALPKSKLFREHRDWFVKDEKGKSRIVSHNWGGFHALDIYNEGAREYIRTVLKTVLEDWGYDMVKLDFLYACCYRPIHNKSRGEIMCDAMDLIRECCGDKIVLGCGVPLAPAFGKVDFCRIGADVALDWYKKPFSREDVSTQNTVNNTVFRRHLDGRAWLNDPDVFLLRDENMKMTMPQRELIALVNSLFGNLLFVSDNVSTYTEKQAKIFKQTVTRTKAKILSADIDKSSTVTAVYELDGERKTLCFNLKTGEVK
jgi:alpha-galactosidase